MPFGEPFDGYYKHIITPAVEKTGLKALRADEIYGARRVMRDVWDHIWRARVVIADVTGANPNVNYELGLCHALAVPTILVTKDIAQVPFDYRDRRCIIYDTSRALWEDDLADKLQKSITALLVEDVLEADLPWPYDTSVLAATGNATASVVIQNPREIMLRGISALQQVIAKAYGPSGVDVSVRLEGNDSVALKKGLKIALGFRSANVLEEEGIAQMRLAARATDNRAGDGTKVTILLGHAMVKGGDLAIARGHQPREV